MEPEQLKTVWDEAEAAPAARRIDAAFLAAGLFLTRLLSSRPWAGGVALRVLGRGADVDGTVLFAPLLGMGAPTERRASGSPTSNAPEPRLKVHVPRVISLAMLNAVGIRGLSGFDTLLFNVRRDARLETYSFRAIASMAPENFRAVLSKDARPLLCLVGRDDEAFRAEAYPGAMKAHRTARTRVLDGVSHEGVAKSPLAFDALRGWLTSEVGTRGGGEVPRRAPHVARAGVELLLPPPRPRDRLGHPCLGP